MSESLLGDISDRAKSAFASIPFPSKKDGRWRFGDVGAWGVEALFPFFSGKFENVESSVCGKAAAEIANGACDIKIFDGQILQADVPGGVEVLPMAEAARAYPENVERFFDMGTGKFDLLASAKSEAGAYIKIPAGAEVELSLKLASSLPVSASSLIFDVGEGASLKLWRDCAVFDRSFSAFRTLWLAGPKSRIESANFKFSGEVSRAYEREDFKVSDDVEIIDALAQASPSHSRHEKNFDVFGRRASVDSRAFFGICGSITHDFRTVQKHSAPDSGSSLAVRSAVYDSASLAFSGLIRVETSARKTKSYQSCRSLLFSPSARAQAAPELEIIANDVECSHGCAISKPDKDQLFYMNSRGLSESEAFALIARGFAESSFEKISNSSRVEKYLETAF